MHDEFAIINASAQDHYKSTLHNRSDTLDGVHYQKNAKIQQHIAATTPYSNLQLKDNNRKSTLVCKTTNNKNNKSRSRSKHVSQQHPSSPSFHINFSHLYYCNSNIHEKSTTINKQTERAKINKTRVNASYRKTQASKKQTSSSSLNMTQTQQNLSSALKRTKVVTFVKNGDLNHVKTVQVTPHRYGHFEELLMDLDKAIGLPYGVRRVYTPDNGHRINSIDQLLDQGIYVCTGFEKFKPINYAKTI